MLLLLSSLLLC